MTDQTARRLLIVSDTLTGGIGECVHRQAAWFTARGWQVKVAAPAGEAAARPLSGHIALTLPKTVRDARAVTRSSRQVRELRRNLHPTVVHCHGARSFAVTRLSGLAAPYVTLHTIDRVSSDPVGYGALRRPALAALSMLAARAFAVFPGAPPGWTFLPHASGRLPDLTQLGPPKAASPTFLWVGRLSEPKRPDLFVQAMGALAARRTGVLGLMAGSGPQADAVRAQIDESRAPVKMLGQVDDLAPLLDQAWAVVVLAHSEGVPFALQEAMWVGRAIVASALPGARWLLGTDSTGGSLVDTYQDAATALERLCDSGEAAGAGRAAAGRIRDLLGPDDPWAAVEEAYLRGLQRKWRVARTA